MKDNKNEGLMHKQLKDLFFQYLIGVGCTEIQEEKIINDIRYDLYFKNPNNSFGVIEIGDLNCNHQNIWKRRRKAFESNIQLWINVPFSVYDNLDLLEALTGRAIYEGTGEKIHHCMDCYYERSVHNRGFLGILTYNLILKNKEKKELNMFIWDVFLEFDDIIHLEYHKKQEEHYEANKS